MRSEIKNNELWLIEDELSKLPAKSPGIFFILKTRIQQFYSRNSLTIKLLHKKYHEIQKKYIVHDDKDAPLKAKPIDGKEEDWQYLESVVGDNGQLLTGDKVKEAYKQEAEEFLNRSVKVEL